MRNVRPRVLVANDDDLDASQPTPALPVDQFFMSNAQPVIDMADDDMDPLLPATMVGAPTSVHQRTEIEDRLESLFSRGRELANTLVRPEENIDDMAIVAATEVLKRHILSLVPVWHDIPTMLLVALGAIVFHLRPPASRCPLHVPRFLVEIRRRLLFIDSSQD